MSPKRGVLPRKCVQRGFGQPFTGWQLIDRRNALSSLASNEIENERTGRQSDLARKLRFPAATNPAAQAVHAESSASNRHWHKSRTYPAGVISLGT
jgi:hypothetical protein